MRIQHNIMAMNAYRNYTNNTSALSKNLEKLSSGYRINRAGDDAAGLAISEKMRAQITALGTAQKNVKDGISLVKTAEGATQEIHDMLNRMVDLATQSANGTYQNEVDREAIEDEFNALKTEINRIADSSNFNGIKLLDGSMDTTVKTTGLADVDITPVKEGQLGKEPQAGVFSVDFKNAKITNGGAADDTIKYAIFDKEVTFDALGAGKFMSDTEIAQAVADKWNAQAEADRTLHGAVLTASVDGTKVTFTMDKAPTEKWATAAGNLSSAFTVGTDTTMSNGEQYLVNTVKEPVDNTMGRMYAHGKFDLTTDMVADGNTLTIGNETYVFAVGKDSKYKDLENVVDLTDYSSITTDTLGIAARRLTTAAQDNAVFDVGAKTTANGIEIQLSEKEGGVDYAKNNLAGPDGKTSVTGAVNDVTKADWAGLVKTGSVDSSAMGKGLSLQIGEDSESYNQLKLSISDMHTSALGLDSLTLGTQEGAQKAVSAIKDAINSVSSTRGKLGATQNRLEHTANNLSTMKENIQDAESTIRDTDIAEEMMAYTKNNILVQSAQAMLAQANQIPQGVLQLLG